MSSDDLRRIVLPSPVRLAVEKLQAGINLSETQQALSMAKRHAEGFVLGLETACALRSVDIEVLYIVFESTAADRCSRLQSDLVLN